MIHKSPHDAGLSVECRQALRSLGVTKVVVHFSGGNDSGGADSIEAFTAADEPVEIPQSDAYVRNTWTGSTYVDEGWHVSEWKDGKRTSRPATDEEIHWAEFSNELERPIYDRWGSFAGDFDVQGTVTWNIATGLYDMEGEESFSVWRSI